MIAGSRRVSAKELPPLLPGGLPPLMKLLTAAFLRYSSSTSRLLRLRMNKKMPPAIPAIATNPITTPAAIPALLGLLEEDEDPELPDEEELLAVTTTVWPPTVTTDGFAVVVDDAVAEFFAEVDVSEAAGSALVTEVVNPVR
jgi:hypothetical protein